MGRSTVGHSLVTQGVVGFGSGGDANTGAVIAGSGRQALLWSWGTGSGHPGGRNWKPPPAACRPVRFSTAGQGVQCIRTRPRSPGVHAPFRGGHGCAARAVRLAIRWTRPRPLGSVEQASDSRKDTATCRRATKGPSCRGGGSRASVSDPPLLRAHILDNVQEDMAGLSRGGFGPIVP